MQASTHIELLVDPAAANLGPAEVATIERAMVDAGLAPPADIHPGSILLKGIPPDRARKLGAIIRDSGIPIQMRVTPMKAKPGSTASVHVLAKYAAECEAMMLRTRRLDMGWAALLSVAVATPLAAAYAYTCLRGPLRYILGALFCEVSRFDMWEFLTSLLSLAPLTFSGLYVALRKRRQRRFWWR